MPEYNATPSNTTLFYHTRNIATGDTLSTCGLQCKSHVVDGKEDTALILSACESQQAILSRTPVEMYITDYFYTSFRPNNRVGSYREKIQSVDRDDELVITPGSPSKADGIASESFQITQGIRQESLITDKEMAAEAKGFWTSFKQKVYAWFNALPDPIAGENILVKHNGTPTPSYHPYTPPLGAFNLYDASCRVKLRHHLMFHEATIAGGVFIPDSVGFYFPGAAAGAKVKVNVKLNLEAFCYEFESSDGSRAYKQLNISPILRAYTVPVKWCNRYPLDEQAHIVHMDVPLGDFNIPKPTQSYTTESASIEETEVEVELTVPESRYLFLAVLPAPADLIGWARSHINDTSPSDDNYDEHNWTVRPSVIESRFECEVNAEFSINPTDIGEPRTA